MVNFRRLATHAKRAVDSAGGPDAVKDKAARVKEVAQGKGTISEKAKRAAEIAREKEQPGRPTGSTTEPGADPGRDIAGPAQPAAGADGPGGRTDKRV